MHTVEKKKKFAILNKLHKNMKQNLYYKMATGKAEFSTFIEKKTHTHNPLKSSTKKYTKWEGGGLVKSFLMMEPETIFTLEFPAPKLPMDEDWNIYLS